MKLCLNSELAIETPLLNFGSVVIRKHFDANGKKCNYCPFFVFTKAFEFKFCGSKATSDKQIYSDFSKGMK